jgi:hypothetical protein
MITVSGVLAGAFFLTETIGKFFYYTSIMGIFFVVAWHKILLESERTVVGIRVLAAFGGKRRK